MIKLDIEPMSKPRQTQGDKWKKRPNVMRYRYWADELRLRCSMARFELNGYLNTIFVIPMPKSWSKKKKALMDGNYHTQKPDLDNLAKAFQDALLGDDSGVAVHNISKIWGYKGQIILNP